VHRTNSIRVERLEDRLAPSITHDTSVLKTPGPTDTVIVTAINPAGNQAVGQNTTFEVSNRDARLYR